MLIRTQTDCFFFHKFTNAKDFVDVIGDFTVKTDEWNFMKSQSHVAQANLKLAACIISQSSGKWMIAISEHQDVNNAFYVRSIVSQKDDIEISIEEEEQIIKDLATSFEIFISGQSLEIKIEITGGMQEIKLHHIIKGKRTRMIFQKYIEPISTHRIHHPYDIGRLDRFINYYLKYNRQPLVYDQLKKWLIYEKKWSSKNAQWCIDRIET
ncbi:MAG: hypothetical protein WBB82_13860, partial [Limnothrix sp.]